MLEASQLESNKIEQQKPTNRTLGLLSCFVDLTECVLEDKVHELSFSCPRITDCYKKYLLTVANIGETVGIYKCIKSAYAEVLKNEKIDILDFTIYDNKLLYSKMKAKPDICFNTLQEPQIIALEDEHTLVRHAFCPTIVSGDNTDYIYYIKTVTSKVRIQRAECINLKYSIDVSKGQNVRVYDKFNKLAFVETMDVIFYNDIYWLIGNRKYRTNHNSYKGIGVWISSDGLNFYPYLDYPIIICYENDDINYPFAEIHGDIITIYFSYYNSFTGTTNIHKFKTDLHISEVLKWKTLRQKSTKCY